MNRVEPHVKPFLDGIQQVGFVGTVEAPEEAESGDLMVTVTDRNGEPFRFRSEFRTSYFDRASVHTTIAKAREHQRDAGCPTLVLARYVPLPTAEQFLKAGVNFVDLAGNLHLVLGTRYERTIMGHVESQRVKEQRQVTASQLQVLTVFATRPEAVAWPVREIGMQAGVSKSTAAGVRSELAESDPKRFRMTRATEDLLVSGYAQILRPKLVLGRFRSPDRELADMVKRLPEAAAGSGCRYALSGGGAADALQHFYLGPELPLFVSDGGAELRQRLRLLPDRNGPITLLRAFGEVVFWREVSGTMVAPPWLVYSELMNAGDPRAHEAALELHREFLAQ